MAQLGDFTRGAAVRGILPDGLVTVIDVRWIGTVAVEVTYKDSVGRLGNELIYRDRINYDLAKLLAHAKEPA